MTIALLRFPFLVQKLIFEDIAFFDVLSITTLSRKSNATARACLRHHKYHLRYEQNLRFRLGRKFSRKYENVLDLLLIDQAWSPMPCPLYRIGNQEVPIASSCTESNGKCFTTGWVYCDNIPDFAMETLRYFSIMLPNLSVTLKFRIYDAETFRDTVHSVEGIEEIKEINVGTSIVEHERYPRDEFVKLILDESQRAKNLSVSFWIKDDFVYATPFKFDSVFMSSAKWVSRNTFIKLFLSCKKVELHDKDFNDEDLTAIFKAWREGSPLEFLQFFGTDDFYREKTLNKILEGIPGAVSLQNAVIRDHRRYDYIQLGNGECYLIQQKKAQTTALICITDEYVMLTTNFERDVDERIPQLIEVRHPVNRDMDREDDVRRFFFRR